MEREKIDSAYNQHQSCKIQWTGSGGVIMSSWKLIFQQSKVNNGAYEGDRLPAQNWHWPQETWFQKGLRYLQRSNGRDAKESTSASLQ